MKHLWGRRRDQSGLEDELRASRPEPSSDFVQRLAASVRSRRETGGSLRLGFAAGLTALLLVAVGSFGGFGYAGNGLQSSYKSAKKVFVKAKNPKKNAPVLQQGGGPAGDQYKRFICHRTGSNKNPYVLIQVAESAVQAHVNHPPKNGRSDIIFPPGTSRQTAAANCPPRA